MKSLFRNTLVRSKDSIVKDSLQSQLIACVKDIQLDHAHSGKFQKSSDAADALCTILEAIFIHGIKETLADKMAIAIGDPDIRPEPNFWPALLVFSHRDLIDQIGRLNFVSTDIGRCRAWIRMSLNDSLLTSYLQSMLAQNKSLSSFYKRSAYLRDTERLDVCVSLVAGIEAYSFNMACNTGLLNTWSNPPLVMSGVWSPALKACPITSGTDIARSLTAEDSASRMAEDSISSVISVASYYQSSIESNFDEEEALKIILGSDVETLKQNRNLKSLSKSPPSNVEVQQQKEKFDENNEPEATTFQTVKNEKESGPIEVCSDVVTESSTGCEELVDKKDVEPKPENPKLQSYHSLVESYNQSSTTTSGVPDLQVLLQKFEPPSNALGTSTITLSNSDSDSGDKLDFEIVSDTFDPTSIPEFRMFTLHINRIPTEQGLDGQNYICKSCDQHVGVNFRIAKVCGLTGAYYCSDCYSTDPSPELCVIPARAIHNWDFRRYSVSRSAAEFLAYIQLYPLFDISVINPKIYSVVEEMSRLKDLRVRLNFLQAYLVTCKGNAVETLKKQIWPKEYLYEKIHLYSLTDLMQASTGALENTLRKAADISQSHILSCPVCTQKGFICEICKDPNIIFPFDLDNTYRCKDCSGVYHDKCLQAGQLCPKCLRIQQRLLNTQNS